jgi:hypothetical protein
MSDTCEVVWTFNGKRFQRRVAMSAVRLWLTTGTNVCGPDRLDFQEVSLESHITLFSMPMKT